LDIIAFCGYVDRMIPSRRNWPAAPADGVEQQSDIFVTAVAGDFDQAVEVAAVPFRF
jgi:hypothetical protein